MGIFGGKIDVGKTAKNLLDKLDDSKLTAQEKADNTRDFVKDTLSENTARSKTRRTIAKVIIYNFFAAFWIVLLTYFLNAFKVIQIDINEAINIIVKFQIPTAFLAVIAFFFGGYYLNKHRKK